MSSHQNASETTLPSQPEGPQLISLGWALRRTALWLGMLFAMVFVGAWLFYASIDPDEASAGFATTGEATQTGQ